MVNAVSLTKDDLVIEIGPGGGVLTEELLKKLDYTIQEIEDSKLVYDTPAATYIREQCNSMITFGKDYIKNTVIPGIHNLDVPIQEYNQFLYYILDEEQRKEYEKELEEKDPKRYREFKEWVEMLEMGGKYRVKHKKEDP